MWGCPLCSPCEESPLHGRAVAELGAVLWAPLKGCAQAATLSVLLPLLFRKLIHSLIPAPLHLPPLSC